MKPGNVLSYSFLVGVLYGFRITSQASHRSKGLSDFEHVSLHDSEHGYRLYRYLRLRRVRIPQIAGAPESLHVWFENQGIYAYSIVCCGSRVYKKKYFGMTMFLIIDPCLNTFYCCPIAWMMAWRAWARAGLWE